MTRVELVAATRLLRVRTLHRQIRSSSSSNHQLAFVRGYAGAQLNAGSVHGNSNEHASKGPDLVNNRLEHAEPTTG